MSFSSSGYSNEMKLLLTATAKRWRDEIREPIYSISIWTDPEAAESAISLETREHSDQFIAGVHAFARQRAEAQLRKGNAKMADLLLAHLARFRNDSPADFAFRNFATISNASLPRRWNESDWPRLTACLLQVREEAIETFQAFDLTEDAEIGVNTASSWYDKIKRVKS